MTPDKMLKSALRACSRDVIASLATSAGVDKRILHRAGRGQVISVDHHLRLCGALGIDPLDGRPIRKRAVGPFKYAAFGRRVHALRGTVSLRAFGTMHSLSAATVYRVETGGEQTSIITPAASMRTVAVLCEALVLHPFDFVSATVKRETVTETRRAAA